MRHELGGEPEYLVSWRGYGSEENSWEPAEHIYDPELVNEYEARMARIAVRLVRLPVRMPVLQPQRHK